MAADPESSRRQLREALWLFVAGVLNAGFAIAILLIWFWPDSEASIYPDVWTVLVGLSASAVTALFVGLITILIEVNTLGTISTIDENFNSQLLERLCFILAEPNGTYSRSMITAKDLLSGITTGLPITRSIITSQILTTFRQSLDVQPDSFGFYEVRVAPSGNGSTQLVPFRHGPHQFMPPPRFSKNHSGSLLTQLIHSGAIPTKNRQIWEIGCGPGYITKALVEIGEPKHVYAIDIDGKAMNAARQNVGQNTPMGITFIQADCLDFELGVDNSHENKKMLVVIPPEDAPAFSSHSEIDQPPFTVDIVLIELPLLPYFGSRHLSRWEQPYLEHSDLKENLLPPTVKKILNRLAPSIAASATILVFPFCAANDREEQAVLNEVKELLGEACSVVPVTEGEENGFLRCCLAKAVTTPETK